MTKDDTKTPDPFGPANYAAVKKRIIQDFEDATAGGKVETPPHEDHPDAVRLIDEAFGRAEAALGTNVLPFVRRRPAEG